MDEKTYNQAIERLTKVNEVIAGLDPAIRADAFALLKDYVTEGSANVEGGEEDAGGDGGGQTKSNTPGDYDALIEKHESDKDYENAVLALAIAYDRHGRGPMQLSTVKSVADDYNLTVSDRLDKFFGGAKRDGKEVFRKQADGWKITPSGETWLKKTYGVARGKKPLTDPTS